MFVSLVGRCFTPGEFAIPGATDQSVLLTSQATLLNLTCAAKPSTPEPGSVCFM